MIEIFLINLNRSSDRLSKMAYLFDNADLDFERIEAVDGSALTATDLGRVDGQKSKQTLGEELHPGEIGCFLSHIKAAEKVLTSSDDYALVLEDDATVPVYAADFLKSLPRCLLQSNLEQWSVINLGNPPSKLMRKRSTINAGTASFDLYSAFYFPVLTTALLWSKSGAEQFLRSADEFYLPIDIHLQNLQSVAGKGLAVRPAPFKAQPVESTIDSSISGTPQRSRPNTSRTSLPRKWQNYSHAITNYLRQRS